MPEGDTVWRASRRLHDALAGHELRTSEFRVPRFATVDLVGQQVIEVVSRGKWILMHTETISIASHLKMDGEWHIYAPGERWRRPAHRARAVLATADRQAVGFTLGRLEVLTREREHVITNRLGPDLLADDFDAAQAASNLSADPARPAYLALLDQSLLAGLGNVYANELLFFLRCRPDRPIGELDAGTAVAKAHDLITTNLHRPYRNFTGLRRRSESTWVYLRAGRSCRRCGTTIRTATLGDHPTRERVVFWCPSCQT